MMLSKRLRLMVLIACMYIPAHMQAPWAIGVGKLMVNGTATLCMALCTTGMAIGTCAQIQESLEASEMSLGERCGAAAMWLALGSALTGGCGLTTRYFYDGVREALTAVRTDLRMKRLLSI